MIIYKTTNKLNGKIYVGKTTGNRKDDQYYYGSGIWIKRALKKYGTDNFTRELLEECSDDTVDEREIYWIDKLRARDHKIGYNFATGGEGGLVVPREYLSKRVKEKQWGEGSEERRAAMSKRMTGDNNSGSKVLKVTHPDGKVEIAKGIRNWCRENDAVYNTIWRWATTSTTVQRTGVKDTSWAFAPMSIKYKGFKFEIIDQVEYNK